FLMIACSISGTRASAQDSRWVLPIVKRDSLLNGLQLAIIERGGTGSVSVRLRVNNGATFDLANKGGLADLTAGMLLKGSAGLDAKGVADMVESLGLTVSVQTGWDATDITINGPSSALESIFDLLSRVVTAPVFDQKALDSLKSARTAAIKAEAEKESDWTKRKALELLFASHPFGRPARGTEESISRITRNDLVYFYNRFYIANNSVLLVMGDVVPDNVTRLARTRLGSWKKGERVPATFRPPEPGTGRRLVIADRPATEVARACIAQIGVTRKSPDFYELLVISEILSGQYSRLAAASPRSSVSFELDLRGLAGPMLVEVGAPPDSLLALLDESLAVLSNIQSGRVTADELEVAKARAISRLGDSLRTPEGAAGVLLDIELYGLGRDFLISFSEKINGVSVPDVARAAQAQLRPETAVISVAGPMSRLEPGLKKLGSVAARY
ncbi:MAG TPA: pitrilysin family protein, partial [Blastocatellia bacterium]|nr:pitrilysin family protein [Blastocatellia bacterium]